MLKRILSVVLVLVYLLSPSKVFTQSTYFSISPEAPLQGDAILIQINGLSKIEQVKKITFADKKVAIFLYNNLPSGLIPIDLNRKAADYKLVAEMANGETLEKTITISERERPKEVIGIPEKLGGNTKAAQDKLVATLAKDKQSVTGLKTNKNSLWTKAFIHPLKTIHITSPYGFSRQTGEYSIPHKGTDYRAKIGTEVLSINRGVVRIAQSYRNYGKSVFIDHGQGLVSYYLHLSKYKVKVGQVVERGQVIALSGNTGYAQGAHLHLGIKLNEITIDPERFFALFK